MEELDELLMGFARDADKILKDELRRFDVKYSYAEARRYNVRSVVYREIEELTDILAR